ncbi:insulinase family protein [Candidatus Pacearchaeota archaeon]|nr:insulinase family protein [Candidatus Pacearchaeota archaeon]
MKQSQFFRKKLDNGITVIFEKRDVPVVAVATSVKFGAQYESEKIKGISHFIEHLVFKGTKNRTVTEIAQEAESKGGIINAFTSEEVTSYWNKVPSKHFSLGADISRDLVLNPLFEKEPLERERKVILEEIKMYHDNPSTHVLEKIKELLYNNPFNLSIAGTHDTVAGLTHDDVVRLHKKIYTSNQMIFSVVGKASWSEVLAEAKKFPKTRSVIHDIPIGFRNGEQIEKRKGIDQAHEVIGFHMPKLNDKNRYAAEIFDSILGGGMSSRLFQEIREKRGLCYAIKSHLEQSKDYSYEMIYSGTMPENVKKIKDLVLIEVKKINHLTQSDLTEAKERLIGLRQITKEKCDSTMIELLQEELGGDAKAYYDYENRINAVKLKAVQDVSKLKGYSFAALVPG